MFFKATSVLLLTSLFAMLTAAPAEARRKRPAKARASAPTSQALVFRSTGSGGAMGNVKRRDRTVTFRRQGKQVRISIQDHVANRTISGTADLGPDRELLTDDAELANAANILAITPAVLADLRSSRGNVVTESLAEANGKIYEVELEHELRSNAPDGGATVVTHTRSTDGKLRLETVSRVDRNGVPLSATTRGTLKVFLFSADIQLSLQRVSGTGI